LGNIGVHLGEVGLILIKRDSTGSSESSGGERCRDEQRRRENHFLSVLKVENAERRLVRFWAEKFKYYWLLYPTFPSVTPNMGHQEK
jgi:hypothetical protein